MTESKHAKKYVWPDMVFKEFLTIIAITIILITWSLLMNAPLREAAAPERSENPSKAPWYFAGLQELLVYFDPWIAGVMIPVIIAAALIIIPYIDTNPQGKGRYAFSLRRFAVANFLFGFLLWWVLIFTGYFLRGPNWQLYLPWESWGTVKETENHLLSLSPAVGLACMAVYFGLGMILPVLMSMDIYLCNGFLKYIIVMSLVLLMYSVPVKIFLRLAFNIKYVLVTPWFNI